MPVEVRSGPVVAQDPRVATLTLIAGLPGAGKTTRAKELAAMRPALRLTPDHWMIPLFGDSLAGGKRFVLEGRLISVALQALRLGTQRCARGGLRAVGPLNGRALRGAGAVGQGVQAALRGLVTCGYRLQLARIARRDEHRATVRWLDLAVEGAVPGA